MGYLLDMILRRTRNRIWSLFSEGTQIHIMLVWYTFLTVSLVVILPTLILTVLGIVWWKALLMVLGMILFVPVLAIVVATLGT